MDRKKPSLKAAWVLLFFCLLTGGGISASRAAATPGFQLVLVLDLPTLPDRNLSAESLCQAAGLLIRLLPDSAYLGLAAPETELPAAPLGTSARREILEALRAMKPPPRPQACADMVAQSLKLFQPGGPEKRGLFILSDGGAGAEPKEKNAHLEEIARMAAQARKAGVAILSASRLSGFSSEETLALTMATGGRFWDAGTASQLIAAMLNFYVRLGQHQEAPIAGADFRIDPWVKQAMVVALRLVPGKAVTLTTPSGAAITPRTHPRTMGWVAGRDYDLITISAPPSGIWSLAGARPADSRVFLDTELTLTETGVPKAAGADEALSVAVALAGPDTALAGSQGLAATAFLAEMQMNHREPRTIKLQPPEDGESSASLPDARVGRFPPLHQEGDAALRILALGKVFQRSVEIPITITRPWYRVTLPAAAGPQGPPISFQPDQHRLPRPLEGSVTLQSPRGSLAGAFIKPAMGSEIIVLRPPGWEDICRADLQLTALAPGGRPLIIASGPQPLTIPSGAPETAAAPAGHAISGKKAQISDPAKTRKSKRRWLCLSLAGLGLLFLLGAGLLFWLDGRGDQDAEADEGADDPSDKGNLRQKAKVDVLMKEKAQLQAELEEKKRQVDQLKQEKAALQEELARSKEKSLGSSKTLEELEKRLEEAEREARGFQQEYMALYAHSQEEKNKLKKN